MASPWGWGWFITLSTYRLRRGWSALMSLFICWRAERYRSWDILIFQSVVTSISVFMWHTLHCHCVMCCLSLLSHQTEKWPFSCFVSLQAIPINIPHFLSYSCSMSRQLARYYGLCLSSATVPWLKIFLGWLSSQFGFGPLRSSSPLIVAMNASAAQTDETFSDPLWCIQIWRWFAENCSF